MENGREEESTGIVNARRVSNGYKMLVLTSKVIIGFPVSRWGLKFPGIATDVQITEIISYGGWTL